MSTELTAGVLVALTGLIPVVVVGLIKLLNWWQSRNMQKHEQVRQGRQDRVAEYDALFDRMQEELNAKGRQITSLDQKLDEAVNRAAECERKEARCEARMEYYEAVMVAAGIKFRPWSEVDARFRPPATPDPPVSP